MADSLISIRHLRKEFPDATPLKDVNARIQKGEVISIIGPSGCGKSTFLRCINLLEKPTSGEILIDGMSITNPKCKVPLLRRKMGMVFQSFNLFNHMTVMENIMAAPVDILHKTREEAYDRGIELLRKVGLADKADAFPAELSGGQKQRVAIARTLAMDPEIVLFDEPTSALDPTMVGEVLAVIRGLAKQGLTMLIVTHEMRFARDVSTRVFYMDEGVIYEDGTPGQIFDHPLKEKTRQFIHHLKVFEEHITGTDYDFMGVLSHMEEFGRKHLISQKAIVNMQHVFEELVMQSLIPQLSRQFDLAITIEYSEKTSEVEMRMRFGGAEADPLAGCDEISKKIVENAVSSYRHSYADGMNCVTAFIK
ncbi:MAG: amino acid ABC transporter ATP-binding protein [Spirochaetales bacterium]|nr:amino acid ABC transporter ATP-binding protein [Spirochaetales bacterium]